MTGGGKDLKNRYKSCGYFFKIFNLVKIRKILTEKTSKLLDRCTEKNTGSSVTLVNEKLRFAAYERRASAGILGKNQLQLAENHNPLGEKYRVQRHADCRAVCREITKVVLDAQGKLLDRCTEKNTESSITLVNEKLRFGAYDRIGGVGARAARGFGDISRKFRAAKFVSKLKSILISFNEKINLHAARGFRNVVRKFCGTHFGFHITALFQKFPLRVANRGAILIEFAICMPILIILLFYINDLVRIKRYYSQTEFVAQQMANMIQNISQNRESKKITKIDFQNITALVWLTMFSGTTRWSRPLGYWPGFAMYYVKGEENGNASCVWRVWSTYENSTSPESNMHWDVGNFSYNLSSVHWKNNSSPSSIHHLLKITPGEYKIILETAICGHPNVKNTAGASSIKQKMNLYIASPKIYGSDEGFHTCFNSVVIFTPKPGLFSETAPS